MTTAVILDTETTRAKPGKNGEPVEVIELAWRATDSEVCHIRRYYPQYPMTLGAIAVHKILPSELAQQPPSSSAAGDLPVAEYWIGHNIDFDWSALGKPPVRRICTLALARAVWPELDSHTLSACIYHVLGLTEETRTKLLSAHSAAADIEFCRIVYQALAAKLGATSIERMHVLSEEARIPKIMTFGKFADQPISAVDKGYASWYARQPDPDPYLLVAFRRAGLLR